MIRILATCPVTCLECEQRPNHMRSAGLDLWCRGDGSAVGAGVGVVEEVGEGVTGLEKGQHLAAG